MLAERDKKSAPTATTQNGLLSSSSKKTDVERVSGISRNHNPLRRADGNTGRSHDGSPQSSSISGKESSAKRISEVSGNVSPRKEQMIHEQ